MKKITIICVVLFFALPGFAQQFQWGKLFNSSPCVSNNTLDIATDNNGNSYAATIIGDSLITADTFFASSTFVCDLPYRRQLGNLSAILLSSYSCDGRMRWARLIQCVGNAYVSGLVQQAGKVYVTGAFWDAPNLPHIRYFADSNIIANTNSHYFLACLDSLGRTQWIRFVGNDDKGSDVVSYIKPELQQQALALDGSGNILHFVQVPAGVSLAPSLLSTKGIYRMKYSSNGLLLNTVRLDLNPDYDFGRGGSTLNKLAINKKSNSMYGVFTRAYKDPITSKNITFFYLAAFAENGNLLWKDSLHVSTTYAQFGDYLNSVAYDGNNALFVSVRSQDVAVFELGGLKATYPKNNSMFVGVVKLDTLGKGVWVAASTEFDGTSYIGGTTILPSGDILSIGSTSTLIYNPADKIAPNGKGYIIPMTIVTSADAKQISYYTPLGYPFRLGNNQIGLSAAQFSSVYLDHAGNIYLGGYQYYDTVIYDKQLKLGNLMDSSHVYKGLYPTCKNSLFLRYGIDCRCSQRAKAGFKDSVIQERDVVFTYTGTTQWVDSIVWSFGDGQYKVQRNGFTVPFHHLYSSHNAYTHDTIWVKTYGPCGYDSFYKFPSALAVSSLAGQYEFTVSPNPVASGGQLQLGYSGSVPFGAGQILISDLSGRVVYQEAVCAAAHYSGQRIQLPALAPGIYFLELRHPDRRLVRKLVLQ